MVVEHEPFLLLSPKAEAGVEVVPEGGNVAHSHTQVALTREMSLTSHLHRHTQTGRECSVMNE